MRVEIDELALIFVMAAVAVCIFCGSSGCAYQQVWKRKRMRLGEEDEYDPQWNGRECRAYDRCETAYGRCEWNCPREDSRGGGLVIQL